LQFFLKVLELATSIHKQSYKASEVDSCFYLIGKHNTPTQESTVLNVHKYKQVMQVNVL